MKKKNVVVLGSTGSIGVNAIKVMRRFPDRFRIVGLSAYNNTDLLAAQIKEFKPRRVALKKENAQHLKKKLNGFVIKIFDATCELSEFVCDPKVDIVIIAIEGSRALEPFLAAARAGKIITPANKEALVMAGSLIMKVAKQHGSVVIPVDSEQSAIFQCLRGYSCSQVKKIYLTASGGPLRDVPAKDFDRWPVSRILKHPRWKMGHKITVDCATLMNKGLEVIEAMRLFDLTPDEIEVVIHPESIVHSMVEFIDGSIIAQLGITDMRLPIQYALTYPERLKTGLPGLNFFKQERLTFYKPNIQKFPSLKLCYDVAKKGQTYTTVLNAANEEAVQAFLKEKIKFSHIYQIVQKIVGLHQPSKSHKLADIMRADQWARQQVKSIIKE
jgi:1-deoxy-D-xylulose-5-phosphate reductoisomerase